MDFARQDVVWQGDEPRRYASSEHIRRGFCPHCGTTLSYEHVHHPTYLTLAIASLDAPELVAPRYHIYTVSQPRWLHIQDDLPRYPRERPAQTGGS